MTKEDIINEISRTHYAESLISRIVGASLSPDDAQDLAQIVYMAVLVLPDDKVIDLYESGAMRFYLARVIHNQLVNVGLQFRHVADFRRRSEDLKDIADE